jgi:hypothetical protein
MWSKGYKPGDVIKLVKLFDDKDEPHSVTVVEAHTYTRFDRKQRHQFLRFLSSAEIDEPCSDAAEEVHFAVMSPEEYASLVKNGFFVEVAK